MKWLQFAVGILVGVLLTQMIPWISRQIAEKRLERAKENFWSVQNAAWGYWNQNAEAANSLQHLVDSGYLEAMPINPYTGQPAVQLAYNAPRNLSTTTNDTIKTLQQRPGNFVYMVVDVTEIPEAQRDAPGVKSVFYLLLIAPSGGYRFGDIDHVVMAQSTGMHIRSQYSQNRTTYQMGEDDFLLALRGYRAVELGSEE
jgi:type II secretory pathway pseudopilin PulG